MLTSTAIRKTINATVSVRKKCVLFRFYCSPIASQILPPNGQSMALAIPKSVAFTAAPEIPSSEDSETISTAQKAKNHWVQKIGMAEKWTTYGSQSRSPLLPHRLNRAHMTATGANTARITKDAWATPSKPRCSVPR